LAAIFISYRREDSGGYAGRVCEHLSGRFGADRVFMDIQDIAPGENFADAIDRRMAECDVVLAMIGPHWMDALRSREEADDFVRHELAAALRRGVIVIPVLVGGAPMPKMRDLPAELAPLARRQAVELRDARFDDDLEVLVAALQTYSGASPWRLRSRGMWVVGAAGLALLAALTIYLVLRPGAADVTGTWIAEMRKPGQRVYRIRLELVSISGRVTGRVRYPTGDGVVQDGVLDGTAIRFSTTHVPQFSSEPATIRYDGEVMGEEMRLVAADSAGVAQGLARLQRAQRKTGRAPVDQRGAR
jgi:hypothetical protein